MCKLEEKEQQLKALKEEGAQQKKMVEAEQAKARQAVRDMKKQLSHERVLKLDAFHHFEDMVAKASVAGTHHTTHTHTDAAGCHTTSLCTQSCRHSLPTSCHAGSQSRHDESSPDLPTNC